jgi:ribosomal protein S11
VKTRECGHESSGMDGLIPCRTCEDDATWNAALEAAEKAAEDELGHNREALEMRVKTQSSSAEAAFRARIVAAQSILDGIRSLKRGQS